MTRTVVHIVRRTIEDLEQAVNPEEDGAALNEIKNNVLVAITELELSKLPKLEPPSAPQEESDKESDKEPDKEPDDGHPLR